MSTLEDFRRRWDAQKRIEQAVRRKHGLDQEYAFNPAFWEHPLPEVVCRRNYENIAEHQRLVARRARGNKLRPKPPRSSLSVSEVAEEVQMDENQLGEMRRAEKAAEFEKMVYRVSREVSYLYFVGSMDSMEEWSDDYLKSDRQLVWRDPDKEVDDEDGGDGDKEEAEKCEGDWEEMELD
jgi:hypothetical protein